MDDLERIAARAASSAPGWAATTPPRRATALVATADALLESEGALVPLAMDETGLTRQRLSGELTRTAVQLRLFADQVADGSHLDVRIDEADPDFVLGPRPDIRRYRVPVGPVLNFAASNFPFAFSVAGGDTAAALAAGCPVVVKAHSGHPRLAAQTAAVVAQALEHSGAPAGTLQLISGQEAGVRMLKDPRVKAGSFTGSIAVGRMLADIAAARPAPIPFYGELGSVNPVFVTEAGWRENGEAILEGFVASVSGSAGQLCTKPGFLFVPAGIPIADTIAARAASVAEHRLLNSHITSGYRARRDAVLGAPGVRMLAEGSLRVDDAGNGWTTPTIVSVPVDDLIDGGGTVLDETFGPLSVVVEYGADDDLAAIAARLFPGSLTGTVHLGSAEDTPAVRHLLDELSRTVGRVLVGGWPTGVAVTPAMQHGGPWPATTNDSSTSVGTAAITRFLRPVAYQNVPDRLLPEPLRDSNPWRVPQLRNPAGRSRAWGSRAATA